MNKFKNTVSRIKNVLKEEEVRQAHTHTYTHTWVNDYGWWRQMTMMMTAKKSSHRKPRHAWRQKKLKKENIQAQTHFFFFKKFFNESTISWDLKRYIKCTVHTYKYKSICLLIVEKWEKKWLGDFDMIAKWSREFSNNTRTPNHCDLITYFIWTS